MLLCNTHLWFLTISILLYVRLIYTTKNNKLHYLLCLDGEFYRAVVDDAYDEACMVTFLDFGDEKPIKKSRMRSFPRDLLEAPLAFHLCLAGNFSPIITTDTTLIHTTQETSV